MGEERASREVEEEKGKELPRSIIESNQHRYRDKKRRE
jgi:hypothetical protein